jgi:hypothetical protein
MSGSTRELDAVKAKRAAAKQLRSAEKDFRQWANTVGGVLAQVFGQKDQEAEPQRARAGAAAGRGTGQTSGPRESNLPDDGQTTHKSAGRQRQEEKGRLMMTRGEAGTSKPASWSKKGQKMPCDARDNADGRGDEDEEDRTQPTKCNVTGSMGRHLAQLA